MVKIYLNEPKLAPSLWEYSMKLLLCQYLIKEDFMIRYIGLIFCSLLATIATSQDEISWVSWEEGMELAKEENKKFIVDLYTEWCGWCKKMDATTFHDPFIVEYVNEHFIAIKFDAEQKTEIIFKGVTYKFSKGGRRGHHTLAAKITNGQLRYPTIVFLDENIEVIQAIPGFQKPPMLEQILTYFAEEHHKSVPWVSYSRNYHYRNPNITAPKIAAPKNHTKLASQRKN